MRGTRWRFLTGFAVLALAALGLVGWVTAEPRPERSDGFAINGDQEELGLGPIPMFPLDVNEKDEIVGQAAYPNGRLAAALIREGKLIDLGTLGGNRGTANAINEMGQIVGSSETSSGGEQAFLWEDGRMTSLNPPGAWRSEATDINDRGDIVGRVQFKDGWRAAVWRQGPVSYLEGLAGNERSQLPLRVNNAGQIVGQSAGRAVLWSGGQLLDLGPGHPLDLNDGAQVLLWRSQAKRKKGGFAIWQNGTSRELPAPEGKFASYNGLNNKGVVTGALSENGKSRACVLKDGHIEKLPTRPGDSSGMEINDRGTVVGRTAGR